MTPSIQIMDDNKNLDFLCRVCLIKDDSSIMISLHDPKIRQMFYECTSIAAHREDSSPQKLCAKCWNRCRLSFEFRTQALEAERQLWDSQTQTQPIAFIPKEEPEDTVQEEMDLLNRPRDDPADLSPADEDEDEDEDDDEMDSYSHTDSFDPLCAAATTTQSTSTTGTTPLLPIKSSIKYQQSYKMFLRWMKKHSLEVTEANIGSFFQDMADTRTPNSLWTIYSMLKAQIITNHGIDINQMSSVKAAIREKNIGYIPKKSKSFTADELRKYLKEAPEEHHLVHKVVLILGIYGAMKTTEIYNLQLADVQNGPQSICVTISNKKNHSSRVFSITGSMAQTIRSYLKARMKIPGNKSLMIVYRNGKCINQRLGVNAIGMVPSKVAKYLGLPDATSYTGNGLKKASATILGTISSNFTRIQRTEDYIVEGDSSAGNPQGDSLSDAIAMIGDFPQVPLQNSGW